MNLQIGLQVDAYHKVWYKGTIVQKMNENGVEKVRITFKIYSENGRYQDIQGKRYDGLADDED